MSKSILFIEDDQETAASVKEILSAYEVEVVSRVAEVESFVNRKAPDLAIIDFDLKEMDGLQVYRKIRSRVPSTRTIMLSSSNSVPLAVSAAKMGVADFLRKPLVPNQLRISVEENLHAGEEVLLYPVKIDWLQSESPKVKEMLEGIRKALFLHRNVILAGERGINKREVAELIHAGSFKRKAKLVALDLSSFREENQEAHFWSTIHEIMAEPEIGALQNEEDLCGTLFLENIESVENHFKESLLSFLRRRGGKVNREVLSIVSVYDRNALQKFNLADFAWIEIPPLRERKEDLPCLLNNCLRRCAVRFGRPARGFSGELLDLLSIYDYPGNYRELEVTVEQMVLHSASECLEIKDLPVNFKTFLEWSIKKAFRAGSPDLEEARRKYERDFYEVLLSKTNGDQAAIARFLDLPRTTLTERIEDLGSSLSD